MLVDSLIALTIAFAMAAVGASELRAQGDDAGDHAPATSDYYHGGRYDQGLVPGVRIAAVSEDGALITLRDGTVWEVYLPHRTSTAEWRRGDFVIVKLSPLGQNVGQTRYTYELLNGRAESAAVVEFRGKRTRGRRG
jgi:hypothetical protein